MARSISDIKTALGTAYINQSATQVKYGLTPENVELGFDSIFSKTSVENIFFYAIAFCINVFEQILDAFRTEIQTTVDSAFVANKAWWHAQAMSYQDGDDLVLNTSTFKYEYATIDATKQIVKKVAVREAVQADGVCKVKLYLATENAGTIEPLSTAQKERFEAFAQMITPSGVLRTIITGNGDVVEFGMTVNYNPLLINSDGQLITDVGIVPVDAAISDFINSLNSTNFGGKLNLTKLIDAVQSATGVVDAKLTVFKINTVAQAELWGTYESTNGWFSLGDTAIIYQPQTEL